MRHWIGTCTDIESTKQAELDLQITKSQLDAEQRLLRTVLEQLPVAVIVALAPSGEVVLHNSKMNEIWRRDTFQSKTIEEYGVWNAFHPNGQKYEGYEWPLARSITNDEVVINEDTIVEFGDGTRGILRINSAPVRDENDRIVAGVVISEDVTDITRLTEERAKMMAREQAALESCRMKSEFLANMSHEIRTPLNGVLGMADLLMETSLSEAQEEYVSTIQKSGHLLLVIINDILDFSKVEAGKLELDRVRFQLPDVVQHVEKILLSAADRQNIDLIIEQDPSLPSCIVGDPERIKQILFNLVGNAIKFTKQGYVKLRLLPGRKQLINCRDYCLHIEVVDSGIGINESTMNRLFQPFTQADTSTTRRYGGTGLGLSISKGLITLMNGSIAVSSEMNVGSKFLVDIIVSLPDSGKISKNAELAPSPCRQRTFSGSIALVAEDNTINQLVIRKTLSKFGFSEIIMTSNGQEVLELYYENPHRPAVILMDCQMPVMDGYEASKRIREFESASNLKRIPIIAVTASALRSDVDACMQAGMDDHIAKPFSHVVLGGKLNRWITN